MIMSGQQMTERPTPDALHAMRTMADALAQMAEDRAHSWKDLPGDVALQSFAQAVRKANRELLADG